MGLQLDSETGRMKCSVTGAVLGPEFESEADLGDFLAFIGHYPKDWKERHSFTPSALEDPRGFAEGDLDRCHQEWLARQSNRDLMITFHCKIRDPAALRRHCRAEAERQDWIEEAPEDLAELFRCISDLHLGGPDPLDVGLEIMDQTCELSD